MDQGWAFAAKSSIKGAKRLLAYRTNLETHYPECIDQVNCIDEHFLFMGQPVIGFNSDLHPIIMGINLEHAQDSNQFCCDTSYDWGVESDGKWSVNIDYVKDFSTNQQKADDCPMGCWLEYKFLGTNSQGLQVIEYQQRTGGTGVNDGMIYFTLEKEKLFGYRPRTVWVLRNKGFASSFNE